MLREGFPSVGGSRDVSLPQGFPRRVMITSAPSSRSLSISLTLALNSLMLYVVISSIL